MTEKIRWKSIDCLKGLACIAVVLIHYNFADNVGLAVKTFCRFGVPIFFITSGFFFLYNGVMDDNKTINKIRHIVKLACGSGIFYAVFTIIYNNLKSPEWHVKQYMIEQLTADKVTRFFFTNDPFVYSHLWFLLALIYCYTFFLLFFNKEKLLSCVLFLAPVLLCLYSCMQEFGEALSITVSLGIPGTENRLYIYNLFIFRSLPFFLFGMIIQKYQHRIKNVPLSNKLVIPIIVLGGMIAIWERFAFREAQFYVGTYIMVAAMIIFAIKNPSFDNKVLGFIGRELSLYVYILHIAVGRTIDLIVNQSVLSGTLYYKYARAFIILLLSLVIAFIINQTKKYVGMSKHQHPNLN